jgi:methionyl-tRNA synthetase
MNTVLYVLAEAIGHLAILAQPFMPDAGARLLDLLAVPADRRTFFGLRSASPILASGAELPTPEAVFPRFVEAGEGAAAHS